MRPTTDILIVGAGPAGVAASLMATSLRLRTVVVETEQVGGKLRSISAVENVAGNWSSGPQIAEALSSDLERMQNGGWCTVVPARAAAVTGHQDRAELTLDDDRVLTAQAIVVATGVTALNPADTGWVSAPDGFEPPPLWRTSPESLVGRTYVLGADRPLGTWLRAHPKVSTTLHVLCPPWDEYKAAEVAGEERVRLVPASNVAVVKPSSGDHWTVEATSPDGQRTAYAAGTVLNNLGNKPAALSGLVQESDGYCPNHLQHQRIRIAGDLRSPRFQRISTAQGSGAESALAFYYDALSEAGARAADDPWLFSRAGPRQPPDGHS